MGFSAVSGPGLGAHLPGPAYRPLTPRKGGIAADGRAPVGGHVEFSPVAAGRPLVQEGGTVGGSFYSEKVWLLSDQFFSGFLELVDTVLDDV